MLSQKMYGTLWSLQALKYQMSISISKANTEDFIGRIQRKKGPPSSPDSFLPKTRG